jgi:hypothetical protein
MKSDVFSRIASAAKPSLAMLAIIIGLGLATPSAFAQIPSVGRRSIRETHHRLQLPFQVPDPALSAVAAPAPFP